MSPGRCMIVGVTWGLIAFCLCVALFIMIALPKLAKADEPRGNCVQVDPASLVFTRMGYALAIGDGHATVQHDRVKYWDGPPSYCIPPAGMPELWLPSSAWPQFAETENGFALAQYSPDSAEYRWIHANYPRCCDHRDCAPATVKWTPNGWMVNGAEHLVAEKDAIPWPFGEPFACMVGGKVRCLFLNSGG